MKNLISIFLIIFVTINSHTNAQIFGIRGGCNLAFCVSKNDYGTSYKERIFGGNFGGTIEFKVSDPFSIESGIILNHKGYAIHIPGETDTLIYLTYIDIPINAKFGVKLGKNKLFLMGGPYLGFGLTGSYNSKINGERYAEKVKWGNKNTDDYKRFDFGLILGAEYEFGRFGIGFQYGLGLANILPSGDSNNSQRNRVLSVYFAYKFGKK